MAHVVFTTIPSINGLSQAIWRNGDNDSYENTSKMFSDEDGIRLIGRMGEDNRVQLCYAATGSRLTAVDSRHLTLVRFFEKKLAEHGPHDGRVFLTQIDDVHAKVAAQSLVSAECGVNVTKEPWGKLHNAVLDVLSGLSALGLFCGDWTFTSVFNSFETTSPATTPSA